MPKLHRNVAVLALSIFALGLGEELWQQFPPQYLTALGASGLIVGLFASAKDLLDGLYQYPGGWIADRWGRKRALLLFTLTALGGYAVYALAWHWAVVFAGLVLAMGWKAGAFPTTFAVMAMATQEFTHFRMTLRAFACRVTKGRPRAATVAAFAWVPLPEIERYSLGKADREIVQSLERWQPRLFEES